MEELFQKAKDYVQDHKKQFTIGGSITGAVLVVVIVVSLIVYNTPHQPAIVYEPANACDLLTLAEAKTLLGDQTINGVIQTPVQTGDITTSQCGYSDGLPNVANAVVIAINVRSGINDAGISLNKAQFASGKPTTHTQNVTGVGDTAYFNQINGQLNVYKDSTWIVISYGPGASPQSNTVDDAVKVAKLVLNAQ